MHYGLYKLLEEQFNPAARNKYIYYATHRSLKEK